MNKRLQGTAGRRIGGRYWFCPWQAVQDGQPEQFPPQLLFPAFLLRYIPYMIPIMTAARVRPTTSVAALAI